MIVLKVKKLNFWQSIIGLIGKKNPEPVLIQTRFGIHTFGLKFPIDVLVLEKLKGSLPRPRLAKARRGLIKKNENIYKIIQIKRFLFPNHLFFWNMKYNIILELPANTLSKSHLSVFQNIAISPLV